jgi:hypothetical protein
MSDGPVPSDSTFRQFVGGNKVVGFVSDQATATSPPVPQQGHSHSALRPYIYYAPGYSSPSASLFFLLNPFGPPTGASSSLEYVGNGGGTRSRHCGIHPSDS